MRFLLRLVAFVVVAFAIFWLVQDWRARPAGTATARGVGDRVADLDLNLDLDSIRDELRRTGRIVRRKTVKAAQQVAEATEDARTTAAIKARLALDPQLSALDIGVDTADGRVTLTGWVDSPEHLAKLVRLALEHEGVEEVISTVRVRSTLAEAGATRE
jgi:hyperosmotically inducible protein